MSTVLGPDDDLAAVVRQLEADGYAVEVVPAGPDLPSSYDAFAAALVLPDWFGRNADALYDSLRDWASASQRPLAVVVDGLAALQADDPHGYAVLAAVLDDLEADHPHVTCVLVTR